MDDLSSPGPFDGLSSLLGNFSRRSRPGPGHARARVIPGSAEVASPTRVTVANVVTHRTLAQEQIRGAIGHFVELCRRWTTARHGEEDCQRAQESPNPYNQSLVAQNEAQGWQRWHKVVGEALRGAEEEVVAALRAWGETTRAEEGPVETVRGAIHQGRLYLVVQNQDDGEPRLVVVDLKASLNLDGSVAVVDVMPFSAL